MKKFKGHKIFAAAAGLMLLTSAPILAACGGDNGGNGGNGGGNNGGAVWQEPAADKNYKINLSTAAAENLLEQARTRYGVGQHSSASANFKVKNNTLSNLQANLILEQLQINFLDAQIVKVTGEHSEAYVGLKSHTYYKHDTLSNTNTWVLGREEWITKDEEYFGHYTVHNEKNNGAEKWRTPLNETVLAETMRSNFYLVNLNLGDLVRANSFQASANGNFEIHLNSNSDELAGLKGLTVIVDADGMITREVAEDQSFTINGGNSYAMTITNQYDFMVWDDISSIFTEFENQGEDDSEVRVDYLRDLDLLNISGAGAVLPKAGMQATLARYNANKPAGERISYDDLIANANGELTKVAAILFDQTSAIKSVSGSLNQWRYSTDYQLSYFQADQKHWATTDCNNQSNAAQREWYAWEGNKLFKYTDKMESGLHLQFRDPATDTEIAAVTNNPLQMKMNKLLPNMAEDFTANKIWAVGDVVVIGFTGMKYPYKLPDGGEVIPSNFKYRFDSAGNLVQVRFRQNVLYDQDSPYEYYEEAYNLTFGYQDNAVVLPNGAKDWQTTAQYNQQQNAKLQGGWHIRQDGNKKVCEGFEIQNGDYEIMYDHIRELSVPSTADYFDIGVTLYAESVDVLKIPATVKGFYGDNMEGGRMRYYDVNDLDALSTECMGGVPTRFFTFCFSDNLGRTTYTKIGRFEVDPANPFFKNDAAGNLLTKNDILLSMAANPQAQADGTMTLRFAAVSHGLTDWSDEAHDGIRALLNRYTKFEMAYRGRNSVYSIPDMVAGGNAYMVRATLDKLREIEIYNIHSDTDNSWEQPEIELGVRIDAPQGYQGKEMFLQRAIKYTLSGDFKGIAVKDYIEEGEYNSNEEWVTTYRKVASSIVVNNSNPDWYYNEYSGFYDQDEMVFTADNRSVTQHIYRFSDLGGEVKVNMEVEPNIWLFVPVYQGPATQEELLSGTEYDCTGDYADWKLRYEASTNTLTMTHKTSGEVRTYTREVDCYIFEYRDNRDFHHELTDDEIAELRANAVGTGKTNEIYDDKIGHCNYDVARYNINVTKIRFAAGARLSYLNQPCLPQQRLKPVTIYIEDLATLVCEEYFTLVGWLHDGDKVVIENMTEDQIGPYNNQLNALGFDTHRDKFEFRA